MPFILKLLVTNSIIMTCVVIGRRIPTLGGLIATMPLTGALVMIWLHMDAPGRHQMLTHYTRGALWGIIPSILFFSVAYMCLQRQLPFFVAFLMGFTAWLIGAFIHQWLLR